MEAKLLAGIAMADGKFLFMGKDSADVTYTKSSDAVERLYTWCRAWLGYDTIEVRQATPVVVISIDPTAFESASDAADFVTAFKKHLGGVK